MILYRARGPAVRVLALLLILTGWGVPLAFPHVAEDDLLCDLTESAGSGDVRRLAAADSAAPADHCEVCHSLRSFRHAGLPDGIASNVVFSARALPPAADPRLLGAAPLRLPARAPPA